MEKLNKCIAVALSELGKIQFSGAAVIPAGNAMSALYMAAEEIKLLTAEKFKEKPKEEHDGEQS